MKPVSWGAAGIVVVAVFFFAGTDAEREYTASQVDIERAGGDSNTAAPVQAAAQVISTPPPPQTLGDGQSAHALSTVSNESSRAPTAEPAARARTAAEEIAALRKSPEPNAETHYQIAQRYLECAGWDVKLEGESAPRNALSQRCEDMPAQPEADLIDALTAAAEMGHPEAQFDLALLQPADSEEFTSWMTASAENGYSQAQRELARHLHEREQPDLARAYYWYSQAANNGDLLAAQMVRDVERIMTRSDYTTAQMLFENKGR